MLVTHQRAHLVGFLFKLSSHFPHDGTPPEQDDSKVRNDFPALCYTFSMRKFMRTRYFLTGLISGLITFYFITIPSNGQHEVSLEVPLREILMLGILPGLVFGLSTSWYSIHARNNRILKSILWIIFCTATHFLAYSTFNYTDKHGGLFDQFLIEGLLVGGFVGSTLLAFGSHYIFKKTSAKQKMVIIVCGVVMSLPVWSFFLVLTWQTVMALVIGSTLINKQENL